MRSVGKQPILLGAVCGLEPLPSFDLPGGKVACFGQAPGLAHPVEHTVEFRPLRQPFWAHREDRLERHVAECQRSIGGELRDPRRQAIERFALCIDKSPGVGPGALELVIVERIASDTRIAHGHVDDAHRATLATDRCRHIARHRLTGITRSDRCRDRRHPAERFDKLHSPPDDVGRVGGIDGLDIRAVDESEPKIGAPEPHRNRRRLDQVGKRRERRRRTLDFFGKATDFGLAFSGVENPDDDAPRRAQR